MKGTPPRNLPKVINFEDVNRSRNCDRSDETGTLNNKYRAKYRLCNQKQKQKKQKNKEKLQIKITVAIKIANVSDCIRSMILLFLPLDTSMLNRRNPRSSSTRLHLFNVL